ncbi:dihydropteroate synthase-like protein [Methanocaldococcus indicus]|uniref:dihydropteroate synthase-like protein n=1 Tax=Methanocaldococcus indicus TaxID=213231 RepID=UPI003C6DA1FF
MKILIITGKLAGKRVSEVAKKFNFVDVHIADISVAAFLTPNLIIKEIKELERKKNKKLNEIYDFILVTGLVRGNLDKVYNETGIRCYKSTRDVADLPLLLENIKNIELSPIEPADIKLNRLILEKLEKELLEVEKEKEQFKIGKIKIGDKFPMRVLGEIAHSIYLPKKDLEKKIIYYEESGADMIDLGMVSGENNKDKVKELIKFARDITDLPISIDTLNKYELKEAIGEADLILSVDMGNIDYLLNDLKDSDTAVVALPTNYNINYVPNTVEERVSKMEEFINYLLYNDVDKVIADLILEPINNEFKFIDSVIAYKLFKERNNIPTFFGVGNVSELFDADSHGVNGLLTAIAMEINANILFTPEASSKCKYSIRELKTASKMMFLAKKRKSLPKDIGYNLILYKDKRFIEECSFKSYHLPTIRAEENKSLKLDRGSFKIEIDRENKEIVAIYFERRKPKLIIRGKKAKEIYDTIIRLKLVESLEHSAYLGRELGKAEIALKIGKMYKQDFDLFYNDFWRDIK